jgi:hypothetical protein
MLSCFRWEGHEELSQALGVGDVRAEPLLVRAGLQDHRHALVDGLQEGVGAGHDDGAASDGLSIGIPPLFPETRKGQGQAVLETNEIGLPGAACLFPLIESVRGDETAARAEGAAERGGGRRSGMRGSSNRATSISGSAYSA